LAAWVATHVASTAIPATKLLNFIFVKGNSW
jgi:hypothetical protein